MRKYEIMFIVRPTVSEDELKNDVKNFSDILTNNGASLWNQKIQKWILLFS